MPYLKEHFNTLQISERLLPHNIGLKQLVLGLFAQYNKTLTSYRPNESIRWSYLDASNRPVLDFCIDLKNNLYFCATDQYVQCLSLKTGSQIWKQAITGITKIACSPKNKWLYITDNTNKKLKRYDYNFTFLNEVGYGNSYACNKPAVDDRYDLVILTWSSAIDVSINTIRIKTVSTTLVAIANFMDITPYSKPALSSDNKIYFMAGNTLFYSYNNDINTRTRVTNVFSQSSWDITFTVENDFAYIAATSNAGNPNTTYYLNKIDLVNKSTVWYKRIAYTNTNYVNNEYSVTQDKKYVYYIINPISTLTGIKPTIYVLNKTDGTINREIVINPNGYYNDANIMIWHSYDYIR